MFDPLGTLSPYLAQGEKILWQGHGRPKLISAQSMGGLIFLGIFALISLIQCLIFGGIALSEAGRSGFPLPLLLLPFIFLVIGLAVGIPWLMFGRQMSHALYIVTTQAALIVSNHPWTGKRMTVVSLKSIPVVSLVEHKDGTGTLMFGQNQLPANVRYGGNQWVDPTPAFWNIEQPLQVYQLIRKQMNETTDM